MDEDISPSKKIQLHDSNFYENTILSPASMFLTNVNVMTGSAKHLENVYLAADSVSSNESYRDSTQTYQQQRYSTHSGAAFNNGNCYHHQSQQYEYNDNSATSTALRCAQNNGNELYRSTDYTTCHCIGSSSSSTSISTSSNRNNNNGSSKNNDKNRDDSIININNLNDHDTVTRPPPPPPPPPHHHHHHIHTHGANYFYYERCNNNNNINNSSSSNGTDEDYILSSSSSSLLLQKKPIVKRRNTANRKERRRTLSINNAFADLRDCIPNVPTDTKLSKIKTLRLATSYIGYLLEVLNSNDPVESFKVDLSSHTNKKTLTNLTSYYENTNTNARCSRIHLKTNSTMMIAENAYSGHLQPAENTKKSKGRTGWPQHVWALELKQEQL